MTRKSLKISFIYLTIFSTYFLILLDDNTITSLGVEDGPIETLGAVSFLIASILFLTAYIHSSGSGNHLRYFHTHRNVFYLLLALLLLICFGEEISWGQRLLKWDTPTIIQQLNAQGETNLHNMWLFHREQPDGTITHASYNMNRLFSVFWLLFCVIIPVLDKSSVRMSTLFKHIGVPITPLWIGVLFASYAVSFHLIYNSEFLASYPYEVRSSTNELKEATYAVIFAIVAYYDYRKVAGVRPHRLA